MAKEREFWFTGSEALSRFAEGVAAAQHRLNKGYERQSALECIVLSATILDGLLRVGLVLKAQLDDHTSDVDERLFHQADHDKKRTERWVIDQAELRGVVPKSLADHFRELYDARNKCVHRYIISDVNYTFATNLVFEYADAIENARLEVKKLEEEQHTRDIGLVAAEADTAEPDYDAEMKRWNAEMIAAKESRGKRDR
jgi:uncharacterized protein YutE (UPF0331/DUF86 family)